MTVVTNPLGTGADPNGVTDAQLRATALPMSLATAPLEHALAAATGQIGGQSAVSSFGAISNAGSGITNVNMWQPQIAWNLPAAPVGIEYKSSSASDGVGGTGARKILVIGVGPGFVQQLETVTMNGTTVVASTLTWMAINVMVVFDDPATGFGSAKSNVGDISANITGAGLLQGSIAAGRSVSLHGRYTVPAGFTWLINNFLFIGNKAGSAASSYSLEAITVSANGLLVYGIPVTFQNGIPGVITLPLTPVAVAEKNTLMFRVASVSVAGLDL